MLANVMPIFIQYPQYWCNVRLASFQYCSLNVIDCYNVGQYNADIYPISTILV